MTPAHRTGSDLFADRVEYWVSTPRATFGVMAADGVVTRTAPIAKKWIGKRVIDMMVSYRDSGATVEIIGHANPRGKRACTVCKVTYDFTDPCSHCREDLPGLLVTLNEQQANIIAGIAADTLVLDSAINAANDDELIRYQRLLLARQATIGKPTKEVEFNKRYVATQALQSGLGSIARAMARLDTRPARESALSDLQRAIDVVELAIDGLKESE